MTAGGAILAGLMVAGTALPGRVAGSTVGFDFLFEVRDAGRGEPLVKPGGIAFDARRGEVVVTDRARPELLTFDAAGVFLRRVGRERGFRRARAVEGLIPGAVAPTFHPEPQWP